MKTKPGAGGRPSRLKALLEQGSLPEFTTRLVQVMASVTGLSPTSSGAIKAFAELLGISPKQLSRYLQGEQIPRQNTLRVIEERTGYRAEWLLHGHEPRQVGQVGKSRPCLVEENLVRVPIRRKDLELEGYTVFDLGQLGMAAATSSDNLFYWRAKNERLEPQIVDGDLCLVDTGQVESGWKEGLFLVKWRQEIQVRRVIPVEDYTWVAVNNLDPPWVWPPQDPQTGRLLGRVIRVEREI